MGGRRCGDLKLEGLVTTSKQPSRRLERIGQQRPRLHNNVLAELAGGQRLALKNRPRFQTEASVILDRPKTFSLASRTVRKFRWTSKRRRCKDAFSLRPRTKSDDLGDDGAFFKMEPTTAKTPTPPPTTAAAATPTTTSPTKHTLESSLSSGVTSLDKAGAGLIRRWSETTSSTKNTISEQVCPKHTDSVTRR